jgi:hypothetical protein
LDDRGGWALAILVRRPQPAEDSAFRFALLAGDGRAALELIEAARRLAGETIRFRVAADAALFADNEQAFREAGYVSREWALDILSRQIDAAHPIPPIDLAAVVIADSPEPILRPPD